VPAQTGVTQSRKLVASHDIDAASGVATASVNNVNMAGAIRQRGDKQGRSSPNDHEKVLQLLAVGQSRKRVGRLLKLACRQRDPPGANLMQRLNLHITAKIVCRGPGALIE
jgi:hypothetical protein